MAEKSFPGAVQVLPAAKRTPHPTRVTSAPIPVDPPHASTFHEPTWGAKRFKHGDTATLTAQTPDLPDGREVTLIVEGHINGGWVEQQRLKGTVQGGKISAPVVVRQRGSTPLALRFRVTP